LPASGFLKQEQVNGDMKSRAGAQHFAAPVILKLFSDFSRISTVPVVHINGDSVGFDRCAWEVGVKLMLSR
jgi:hypothetical protein